jgi:hypothetical protein
MHTAQFPVRCAVDHQDLVAAHAELSSLPDDPHLSVFIRGLLLQILSAFISVHLRQGFHFA